MSTLSVGTIKSASSAAPVFQNSSGTEIIQAAKAWVKWNGTGTLAINASFNVSSVTDLGTGYYKVNFTTAFADTSYTANFQGDTAVVPGTGHCVPFIADYDGSAGSEQTTGYTTVIWHLFNSSSSRVDSALSSGVFFR